MKRHGRKSGCELGHNARKVDEICVRCSLCPYIYSVPGLMGVAPINQLRPGLNLMHHQSDKMGLAGGVGADREGR